MESTRAFHKEREPTHREEWEEAYRQIMMKQYSLGHRAFLGGMWVKEIVSAQATHFRKTRRRKSAKKWTVDTIPKAQGILTKLWYARNNELHNNEESDINKKIHAALDRDIDRIYSDKPPSRMLQHADMLFFRRQ